MKVHPVFHVELLERVRPDVIPGRPTKPPPPLIIAGQEEWEVEAILNSKLVRGKLRYLSTVRVSMPPNAPGNLLTLLRDPQTSSAGSIKTIR
jgi:hypothetical protein